MAVAWGRCESGGGGHLKMRSAMERAAGPETRMTEIAAGPLAVAIAAIVSLSACIGPICVVSITADWAEVKSGGCGLGGAGRRLGGI